MEKLFSVILPTLNRHNYLVATTEMLLNQVFDGAFEIIVVDQSDMRDATFERIYSNNEKIRYFHITSFRGLPEARNFGCMQSKYPNLLFLDDDIEIGHDLLEEHFLYLKKEEIGIVAGGATEKNRPNYDVKQPGSFDMFIAHGYRGFHQDQNGYVNHAPGGNFSVKKDLYLRAGGTDENFNVGSALGEETDVCMRVKQMGYKIYYNYKAHILHLAAPSGGCREEDAARFVYAMVHNRTITIHRFCRFYHYPSAYLYTLRIWYAHAVRFKHTFFKQLCKGILDGYRDYKSGVKNSFIKNEIS